MLNFPGCIAKFLKPLSEQEKYNDENDWELPWLIKQKGNFA